MKGKFLKTISNLFFKKDTYFGRLCSGYKCFPAGNYGGKGFINKKIYKLILSGKTCYGCKDCNDNNKQTTILMHNPKQTTNNDDPRYRGHKPNQS